MTPVSMAFAALTIAVALSLQAPAPPEHAACPRCGWRSVPHGRVIEVRTIAELQRAIADAKPRDTILLADGQYPLQRMLEISTPDVTLRSRSGNPDRVVLHGRGMERDPVGVAIGIGASGVTIADITVRQVGYHAVQVRGERGASEFTLHNAKLTDTGQQLLKGSFADNGQVAANGLVACSELAYSTSAPSDYTNGVDILGTKAWVIRDNRFIRIRGPAARGWKGGPAVLAWKGAEDTVVERNLIVDSFRGIALGLTPRYGAVDYDHLRGVVRNNVVVNLHPWADEAIEANGARGASIDHNSVLVNGSLPWSISVRFATATALVRNNLSNRSVIERDGGRVTQSGNVTAATRSWFIDAPGHDLHLLPSAALAIDAGVGIPDVTTDFDRALRPAGKAADAGAFEFGAARTTGPVK